MNRTQLGNHKSSILFSSGLMAVLASSFATGTSAHAANAVSSSESVKTTKVDTKTDNKDKSQDESTSKNKSQDTSKESKGSDKDKKDGNSKSKSKTVTVKLGDTTWSIAKKYDTSVDKIVQDNDLENNGELILVGQKLEVHPGDTTVEKDNSKSNNNSAQSQTSQQSAQQTSQANTTANTAAQTQSNTTSYSTAKYSAPASQAPTVNTQSSSASSSYTSSATGSEASAKEWIAQRESGGSYTAQNGQYYGRYQLSSSYLGGDYSPANQEKVADSYVANRYGSWSNAQAFWQSHGWY